MKKWLKDWFECYGEFLGFLLFCLVAAVLLKGCAWVG